jgi:hypothetical protein
MYHLAHLLHLCATSYLVHHQQIAGTCSVFENKQCLPSVKYSVFQHRGYIDYKIKTRGEGRSGLVAGKGDVKNTNRILI